jgi:hypothetical protein
MRYPVTYALSALLFASLALNVRLWTAPPKPKARAAPVPTAVAEDDGPRDATCESRLQACQQRSWDIARRAIESGHASAPAPTAAPAVAAGPAAQADALCGWAKKNARDTWQRDKDKILFGLGLSLADRDEQEREVLRDAGKMREVAGLDPHAAAEVEGAYRDKRLARIGEAQMALQRQDYGGLLDATHGLFSDEDAILTQVGGPAARDAWRADQTEARTVLLALMASLSDKDWEDSIRW